MRRKHIGLLFTLMSLCAMTALAATETVNGVEWHYQCVDGEAWLGDEEHYYDEEFGWVWQKK